MTETTVLLGERRRRQILNSRDRVELLAWTAVFVPVLLLVLNEGFIDITSALDLIAVSNRALALVATSLLLVHLLLVARVPWIENVFGLDKATHTHKKLGKPVLYLFALHFLLSLVQYSLIDGISLIQSFFYLQGFSDLFLATIGFGLMLLVVFSSISIARKKLSYELWYLVHLLSYVSVAVAIPHQFNLGTDFLSDPLMNLYFLSLYIFVFANIVYFRVAKPVVYSLSNDLRITRIEPESNNTTSIYVSGKQPVQCQSGQFFMVRILTWTNWWKPHPFSVSSSEDDVELRFTIGARGDFTSSIPNIAPGTKVILEGPYGIFSETTRSHQYVTLIAAGIGVAPVRSLAKSLASEPGDVCIIYRVTSAADAALLAELKTISESKGHKLSVLEGSRDDGWLPKLSPGETDVSSLLALSPQLLESDIYVCGPSAWTEEVGLTLQKLGVSQSQVHVEEFAW